MFDDFVGRMKREGVNSLLTPIAFHVSVFGFKSLFLLQYFSCFFQHIFSCSSRSFSFFWLRHSFCSLFTQKPRTKMKEEEIDWGGERES